MQPVTGLEGNLIRHVWCYYNVGNSLSLSKLDAGKDNTTNMREILEIQMSQNRTEHFDSIDPPQCFLWTWPFCVHFVSRLLQRHLVIDWIKELLGLWSETQSTAYTSHSGVNLVCSPLHYPEALDCGSGKT